MLKKIIQKFSYSKDPPYLRILKIYWKKIQIISYFKHILCEKNIKKYVCLHLFLFCSLKKFYTAFKTKYFSFFFFFWQIFFLFLHYFSKKKLIFNSIIPIKCYLRSFSSQWSSSLKINKKKIIQKMEKKKKLKFFDDSWKGSIEWWNYFKALCNSLISRTFF